MSFFKPKKKINQYADTWGIFNVTVQNFPMIFRVRTSFDNYAPLKDYCYQVGIAIPFNQKTETGIVSPQEDKELAEIEDQIIKYIEDDDSGLVGVITGQNMREFVLYTRNHVKVKVAFNSLKNSISGYELQLMVKDDPSWSTYFYLRGNK